MMENCYSLMKITAERGTGGPLRGYGVTATNSFWAPETSGFQTGFATEGTEVTVNEMKTQSTYTDAGWDYDTVWEMNPTTGYPRLQWEKNIKP